MDIETAAQFGEMLGGLAILLTLLFGMRQVKQWNETMKINSARDVANHISSQQIQYAIVLLVNALEDDFTFEEYANMPRKDKDAINALVLGLNTHGILVSKGILSLELVTLFYQQFTIGLNKRLFRLQKIMTQNVKDKVGSEEVSKLPPLEHMVWLLEKIDQMPILRPPSY